MKKSLKALAVLSLFGLGLGSVTACGGSSKSITISVNGTAVGNGKSVNVTETSIFTLNATVDNGSEDDVVVWSTNSPSAITFSSHSGAEITATANTPTTTGWVVAATLESDSTVTTAITVIVDEATRTYSISVDTTSAKTTFFQGETFSTQGLVVNETEYINGTEGDTVELGNSEYTTSIAVGTTLDTLGSQTVTVTSNVDESLTATYVINVVENPLANFFDTMESFSSNNYVEYTITSSNGSYYLYPLNIYTPDFYLNGSLGVFWNKTANQIDQYAITYDDKTGAEIVYYQNILYENKQARTDLVGFIKSSSPAGVTLADWDSSYESMVTSDSTTGGMIATDDAAAFFNDLFGLGYYDSNHDFVPYEVTISQVGDGTNVYEGMYMITFSDGSDVVDAKIISVYDETAQSEVERLTGIIEAKDPSNYKDVSDGYYESNVEFVLSELAGADYFGYQSLLTGDYFYSTPNYTEVVYGETMTNYLGYPYLAEGYYNLEQTSNIGDNTYEAGVLNYAVGATDGSLYLSTTTDTENSFESYDNRWGELIGLTDVDSYKYWSIEGVTISQFTDGTSVFDGYVFQYAIYDNTFDCTDLLLKLDWGLGATKLKFENEDGSQYESVYLEEIYGGSKTEKIVVTVAIVPTSSGNALGPCEMSVYGTVDGETGLLDTFSFMYSSYFDGSDEDVLNASYGSQFADIINPVQA